MPAQFIRASSKLVLLRLNPARLLGESIRLGLEISQMFARTIEFAPQPSHAVQFGLSVPQMLAHVCRLCSQHVELFRERICRSQYGLAMLRNGSNDCRCCPHPSCVRIASAAQIREPAILYLKSACQLLQPLVQLDICSC